MNYLVSQKHPKTGVKNTKVFRPKFAESSDAPPGAVPAPRCHRAASRPLKTLLLALGASALTATLAQNSLHAGSITLSDGNSITLQEKKVTNSNFSISGSGYSASGPDLNWNDIGFNSNANSTNPGKVILRGNNQFSSGTSGTLNIGDGKYGRLQMDASAGLFLTNYTSQSSDERGKVIRIGKSSKFQLAAPDGAFTFTNNRLTGANSDGGVIAANFDNSGNSKTVIDLNTAYLTFQSNEVSRNGGALFAEANSSGAIDVLLNGRVFNFINNTANSSGGVFYIHSNDTSVANLNNFNIQQDRNGTLVFASNKANNGSGGAIYNVGAANEVINNFNCTNSLTLSSNSADNGGSIFSESTTSVQTILSADGITLGENEAQHNGGGIYQISDGENFFSFTSKQSGEIRNNSAALAAGASLDTGGAIHLVGRGANSQIKLEFIQNGGNKLRIKGNTVGTGANKINRAIYIESQNTTSPSLGDISFRMANSIIIALEDEIKAVRTSTTTGYNVAIGGYGTSYSGARFEQTGASAKVYIPGSTIIEERTIHKLENGAIYQTYEENGSPFGSYELQRETTLEIVGTGNVLASKNLQFSKDSILKFDFGSSFAPGNTTPLLTLKGGQTPDTSGNNVLPGNSIIRFNGDITSAGAFYLIDATDLPNGSVAAIGEVSYYPISSITINGNQIAHSRGKVVTGRKYVDAQLTHSASLSTTNPDANKLYLHITEIYGNTETVWTGNNGDLWKSEASTTNVQNWQGSLPMNSTGASTYVQTFYNGDLVTFDDTAPADKRDIDVSTDGVSVGAMTVDNADYKFSGGSIFGKTNGSIYSYSNETNLRPKTDGIFRIKGGANVTIENTIEFSGNPAYPNDNSYRGIQIEEGQLILGDGGKLGVNDNQDVNIANLGMLSFIRTDDYVYSGVVSGGGYFRKSGTGELTLTKNQKFHGIFYLQGGSIVLKNITLKASDIYVGPGTSLKGSGKIEVSRAVIEIHGKIALGETANSIGKLEIVSANSGAVALKPDAQFIINLAAGGNSNRLISTGLTPQDVAANIFIEAGVPFELGDIAGNIHVNEEFLLISTGGSILFQGTQLALGDDVLPRLTKDGYTFSVDSRKVGQTTEIFLRARSVPAGTVVPEPSTYALCGGLATLALAFWRKRRKQ